MFDGNLALSLSLSLSALLPTRVSMSESQTSPLEPLFSLKPMRLCHLTIYLSTHNAAMRPASPLFPFQQSKASAHDMADEPAAGSVGARNGRN